jgi:hypothetical protein
MNTIVEKRIAIKPIPHGWNQQGGEVLTTFLFHSPLHYFIIIIIIISQNPTFEKKIWILKGKTQKKSPHLEIAKGICLTNISFNQFT